MNRLQAICGWMLALSMVMVHVMPAVAIGGSHATGWDGIALATQDDGDDDDDAWDDDGDWEGDDDDDWEGDDDTGVQQPPSGAQSSQGDDDDDWDDDDWDDDGDEWDDDQGDDDWDDDAPDDNDDDDDDVDDEDDRLDRPVANQAILQLQPGVDPSAFAGQYGASVIRVIPEPNMLQLQLDASRDDAAEVDRMLADADVIWAELNFTSQAPEGRPRYFFTSATGEPSVVDGPALPDGLEYTPERACTTGGSIVVAVLDTGVDASHPDIADAVLPNGVNMVDNTFDVTDAGNGLDDDGDGQIDEMVGHGTHVTGTVLQVAPDAEILPIKVLDSDGVGDAFTVTAGVYYAVEQGADVINLSLGSTYDSMAIRTAVEFATGNGVVVIAAAGNGNHQEPAEYPAAGEGAISVAATTDSADKASYSNYHPTVDVSAPGNDVASAYPGGLYTTASGTSMSAPLVTGTVALLLERQPGISPERIVEILQVSSGPLNLSDAALEGLLGSGEFDIDASIACEG